MTNSNIQKLNPYVVQAGELLFLSSQPREYLNVHASKRYLEGEHTHIEHSGLIHTATITRDMDNDPLILCGEPIGSSKVAS